MPFPDIFTREVSEKIIERINSLTPAAKPIWGKMNVAQMLAHCNIAYEMVYDNKHPRPNAFVKLILKAFVKKGVVDESPYRRNQRTAPVFLIKDKKDFEVEKKRLTEYIRKTQELGAVHFDNLPSHSFGRLSIGEWNNLFYKHINHHLTQFGV